MDSIIFALCLGLHSTKAMAPGPTPHAAQLWARRENSMLRPISGMYLNWICSFLPPLLDALDLNWRGRSDWDDAWLEDKPSSNGSNWEEPAAAGYPRQDGETATHGKVQPGERESAPSKLAESDQTVQEAKVAEPSAVSFSCTGRPGTSDYCDFHHCERIVCLFAGIDRKPLVSARTRST